MPRPSSLLGSHHDQNDSPTAPIREAALIARVRANDPIAFESLFRTYYSSLYNFAFRYLQSPDEADDAVQTVFVRVWNARTTWHVAGTLTDYLHLAVRNACRDRLQHDAVARRWREKRVDELKSEFAAGEATVSEVDARVAGAELDATIERAIGELPARRREVFLLRFTEGLSYEAIAKRLGVATKTVETQISRGLKHVRKSLEGGDRS
jgi:RNA polymerase sigma-70 factor (ECF subfamily)